MSCAHAGVVKSLKNVAGNNEMNEENLTAQDPEIPVIQVNGEEVGNALIQQELQMLTDRYAQEMSPQEMDDRKAKIESDARENAVERILLMQQARLEITDVRPEEVEARFAALKGQHGGDEEFAKRFEVTAEDEIRIRADLEEGVRLEKYFELLSQEAVRPVEADAQAYYNEHPEEFVVPERVHAAHIVQHPAQDRPMEKVYAELLNIRERLKSGEDFITLAQSHSQCEDGSYDLGYFERGQMVSSFEDIAFKTATGEYSDVFQTEFGYHILKVLDHKPAAHRAFIDVRYDIEGMLFEERKNEAIGQVADKLRASAEILNLEIVEG
jgi:parvulin-like peptidyl-prolyl isomerase